MSIEAVFVEKVQKRSENSLVISKDGPGKETGIDKRPIKQNILPIGGILSDFIAKKNPKRIKNKISEY